MTLLIALRVLLSVSASAIQKRLVLRGTAILRLWVLTYGSMAPLAALAALLTWRTPPPSFWIDSLAGGALDALGNLAMLAALRATDLSVFGPLNAVRPALALLFGWLFLRESPSAAGLLGIGVTVAGACVVLKEDQAPGSARLSLCRGLGFRLLGFALATLASVFLKRAALTATPEMTLAGWMISGLLCLVIYCALNPRGSVSISSVSPAAFAEGWAILHAIVFLVMQWLTIRIFQQTLLSYAFVFFQLGIVLQVFAGKLFFGEPHFGRRLLGATAMMSGAALIAWRG